jgi:hypothetical protein
VAKIYCRDHINSGQKIETGWVPARIPKSPFPSVLLISYPRFGHRTFAKDALLSEDFGNGHQSPKVEASAPNQASATTSIGNDPQNLRTGGLVATAFSGCLAGYRRPLRCEWRGHSTGVAWCIGAERSSEREYHSFSRGLSRAGWREQATRSRRQGAAEVQISRRSLALLSLLLHSCEPNRAELVRQSVQGNARLSRTLRR